MNESNAYHPNPEINEAIAAEAHEAEAADVRAWFPPRRWQCNCGASHARGHFMSVGRHRCLACGYDGAGGTYVGDDEGMP